MIRNLKVLIAAAMALTALGAIAASGAHAAEEKFHCAVEPCTLTLQKDGTGATAHHVFVVKGETHAGKVGATVSFTCDELTGEATLKTRTDTEATFTKLVYEGPGIAPERKCKVGASESVKVNMNSCDYEFTSTEPTPGKSGTVIHIECTTLNDGIEITIEKVACLKITPTTTIATEASPGVKWHDANTAPPLKTVLTAHVTNIVVPIAAIHILNTENEICKGFFGLRKIEAATYTTGNTNITAETDKEPPVAAAVWWE